MAKKKRYSRKSKSGMSAEVKALIGGMGYAVIAEPLLDQAASKIGLGVSDDVVKGVASWAVYKYMRQPILKEMGRAGMYIAANKFAAAQFGKLNLFSGSNSTSTTSTDAWT